MEFEFCTAIMNLNCHIRYATTKTTEINPLQPGFGLPLATSAKCENKICLAQKILIWRNQLAKKKKKMKIGGGVLQVSETIWTVIKSGYCILHLCQIG